MFDYFADKKDKISDFLGTVLKEKKEEFSFINSLGSDLCRRLLDFCTQGKMIRGGLVSLGYELTGKQGSRSVTQVGAVMELVQSALLIHDDIMDRDPIRRGVKSLYHQYEEMAEKKGLSGSLHIGESMGICAGDVAFFTAFEVLSGIDLPADDYRKVVRLCSREISHVGVAQMQDVYWGASTEPVADDDILKLCLHKTGRYTFSMPLMAGAYLARQKEKVIDTLEKIGEYLGIIFQIKDDELGLFGDEEELGKPVGSDIREGKKTLFYGCLAKKAPEEVVSRLSSIYGNRNISDKDIEFVKKTTIDLGVKNDIDDMTGNLASRANKLILSLNGGRDEYIRILLDLLDYSKGRKR